MRVLLVNIACINGGVEAHFSLLARGLARRGHQVAAYFYIDGSTEYASGRHLFDGICPYWIGPEVAVGEVLASGDYDVVHASLRALEWDLPRVIHRIGYTGAAVATSHGDVIAGWPVDRQGFALTAVSNYLAGRLMESGYEQVEAVHNAVDPDLFNDRGPLRSNARPVLLWVGRSSDADKDLLGFAALVGRVASSGWDVWIVDGRGDSRLNTLETWLPGACRVLRGLVPEEMAAVYRGTADSGGCLVSTSQQEAFGLAVCEAMACGCPVIVPRVGGLPEVVEDGVSGLVYDRTGGTDAALEKLHSLSDRELRQELVASAKERVGTLFGVDQMLDGYEQLYERMRESVKRGGRCRMKPAVLRAALRFRRILKGTKEAE